MNPFNNRWIALLAVGAILLAVAELVGTDEHGGVLSQAAGTNYAPSEESGEGDAAPVEVIRHDLAPQEDPNETADIDEEDLPQVVMADSPDIEDTADAEAGASEGSDADAAEQDAVEDQPSDDESDQ